MGHQKDELEKESLRREKSCVCERRVKLFMDQLQQRLAQPQVYSQPWSSSSSDDSYHRNAWRCCWSGSVCTANRVARLHAGTTVDTSKPDEGTAQV